jgi:fatty-acid desaturase
MALALTLTRWVGWLAFGEGWHNNHHAFEYSARYGVRVMVRVRVTLTLIP